MLDQGQNDSSQFLQRSQRGHVIVVSFFRRSQFWSAWDKLCYIWVWLQRNMKTINVDTSLKALGITELHLTSVLSNKNISAKFGFLVVLTIFWIIINQFLCEPRTNCMTFWRWYGVMPMVLAPMLRVLPCFTWYGVITKREARGLRPSLGIIKRYKLRISWL
jgi:hypothetical protein